MKKHNFNDAIHLRALLKNEYQGVLTESYNNMVGPFGGITAATLLNAVMLHPERIGDPVSLTVNFAGPLALGEFTIEAIPMRTNNSTQHWMIVQRQNGEVATTATAFFAIRKETWGEQELTMPEAVSPDTLIPVKPRLPSHWVQNYDLRFVEGAFNPKEKKEQEISLSIMWVREQPERQLDFPGLASIGDSFFPRMFIRHQEFMPAGTVSLTLHFHATADELEKVGSAHLLASAQASRANRNYADQTANFWDKDGNLLLSSHQMVYFKY